MGKYLSRHDCHDCNVCICICTLDEVSVLNDAEPDIILLELMQGSSAPRYNLTTVELNNLKGYLNHRSSGYTILANPSKIDPQSI